MRCVATRRMLAVLASATLFFSLSTTFGNLFSAQLTIDRQTGKIALINTSGNADLHVLGYSLTSTAGSFNSARWSHIGGSFMQLSGSSNNLAEMDFAGSGTAISAATTLDLGDAWYRTPYQDVQGQLLLDDGTQLTASIQYTGTAIPSGDLNGDSAINAADWTLFKAGAISLAGFSKVQSYFKGDLNGDLKHDLVDFVAFRAAYSAANPAGGFEALLSQAPEPAAGLLLVVGSIAALAGIRQRNINRFFLNNDRAARRAIALVVVAACGLAPAFANADIIPSIQDEAYFLAAANGASVLTSTTSNGERTVHTTRQLMQTFQVTSGFQLNDISLLYARGVTGASATLQLFPVTNTNASSIQTDYNNAAANGGAGFLLNLPFTMPQTLNDNTFRTLKLDLTGAHNINLNTSTGTAGYALLFTPTNPGPVQSTTESFTWRLRTDNSYAAGRAFHDTPAGAQTLRDFVLALTAVTLTLRIDPATGQMQLTNPSNVPISLSAYDIHSTNSSLNPASWTPISRQSLAGFPAGDGSGNGWESPAGMMPADANHDGTADARDYVLLRKLGSSLNGWRQNFGATTGPGGTSSELTEWYLNGSSTLAAGGSINLGQAFQVGGLQSGLQFEYLSGNTIFPGTVKFESIGIGTSLAVPEPNTASLIMMFAVIGLCAGRRRRTIMSAPTVLVCCCLPALWFLPGVPAVAQQSKWVTTGVSGRLIYVPDADGDRVADFSMVGYGVGKKPLPTGLPVVIHVNPLAGDNTQNIQNAINYAASLPLQANGFRGVVELGPGKFDVNGHINITTSGIVLRGAGGGDDLATSTHIVSQNRTDSVATSASTPVINISGSSSGTTRGSQIQIIDKRVPVGAQSFRVASTSGMSAGGMVEIFRPSTAEWIHELGMDAMPPGYEWQTGDRDLHWQRTITRIEGNRVFIDAPITTALDAQWGGGTVRTYNAPNVIRNVAVENLLGQSLDTREETNESRTPTFVGFTRVADGWVRDVETRHFSYASVYTSEADGGRNITVDHVNSRLPSGQVTGGRRYTFAMDGQYSLVKNSTADSGRHDFVTGSDVVGPIAFVNSSVTTARADSGPHHRWGNGLLFDNIAIGGNSINVQNRWTSGTGHGWAGANVVVWNSQANSFIMQAPPTAKGWLIGSTGTINTGDCHLGGATCAGYYDSQGTRVTAGGTQSLYEAQVNDAAEIRDFHWSGDGSWNDATRWDQSLAPAVYRVAQREYLLGDIDKFVYDGTTSVDNAYVSPQWASAIQQIGGLPLAGFDDLSGNKNVAFTIQHQLDSGERVIHASLAMALRQGQSGSAANDFIRLFDTASAHQLTFNQLGWASQINATTPFVGVIDMGAYRDQLQSGLVNVQVGSRTGVDWAMYYATLAAPIADATGARIFLDRGGRATLTGSTATVGQLQIGGSNTGVLHLGSQALLPVTGDLAQSSNGTLELELGGTGQFGRLQAGGQAQLSGTLRVTLVNSFQPSIGQSFQFLTATGGISNTFQETLLPDLPAGEHWNLLYGANAVALQVLSVSPNGIAGDVNQDGLVDSLDVNAFITGWSTTGWSGDFAKYTHGDLNLDGTTNLSDAFLLHQSLQTATAQAALVEWLSQVPEPGSAGSALMALALAILRIRWVR
jgi:hypothetical protein